MFEPAGEVVGGDRSADVVALDGVAAQQAELLQGEAFSTPSATTRRPRLRPRSMVEWTITASLELWSIWETKDRSTLSSCTGRCLR